ncbi:MAG: TolC family protein, partial [Bacteroidota bacterium]|nr:TolC family protein [Bacteroidota bacterium]MDX5430091.1 TolC family protein [Bacteroidota bacterium]MDX5468855.1 TolC family protein [Bacteroidota bacterium]
LLRSAGMEGNGEIHLSDSLAADKLWVFQDIEQKMRQQNATLHLLKLEYLASEHGVKRAQSSRYPSLALFGEYNFLQSQNAVGILKSNQILGPAVGLSLRYDLFNGFQTNRQIEIAKLEREKQALRKEKLDRDLGFDLLNAFENYQLQKQIYTLESRHAVLAKENLLLAEIQLKAGAITSYQFREVQETMLSTQANLAKAWYGIKLAELELAWLSGDLLHFIQGN